MSEPVIVTHNGRDRLVMVSVEEYLRLKEGARQAGRPVVEEATAKRQRSGVDGKPRVAPKTRRAPG